MTNKKNIASKLVLALFILTLISCCLLGSTFARYASGDSGTASIGVAKWDVTLDDSAMTHITVDDNKLSPSMNTYNGTADRQHATGKLLVATIENDGEVDALVTVTASDLAISLTSGDYDASGYSVSGASYTGNGASEDQVAALFSIQLYRSNSATWTSGEALTSGSSFELAVDAEPIYIFAEVTWTSSDLAYNEATSDAIDTWAGMNVASVGCTISYTAVQNSTLPTT